MEISKFVLSGRENARTNGNWTIYRKHLSKKIHILRKKLGIATKPRTKCAGKVFVTAEDIARSHEFGHLLLLTSERAWANAMSMREVHSAEKKGIMSSTRSHIISRLRKAAVYAENLLDLLQDDNASGVRLLNMLEARAYVATLWGASEFEKRDWKRCITFYSEARVIYCALDTVTKNYIYKDVLSDPVDLSIRYCAYQMQLSRTLATTSIAKRFFPRSDVKLVEIVEKLDASVLNDELEELRSKALESDINPKTLTWRSRTINIEDASISTALISVDSAKKSLLEILSLVPITKSRERASAYDGILTACQDVVDVTKHVIDDLSAEGISQDDQRVQNLHITRTAISYDMISWRIGRNRVLVGERDGAVGIQASFARNRNSSQKLKEGRERKLARLRENVVLYDAILQSLGSIKELPGITADTLLLEELDAKYEYFSSLKFLAIARSHSLVLNNRNALALFSQALKKCCTAMEYLSSAMEDTDQYPIKISVTSLDVQFLKDLLFKEVQRHRALVELSDLNKSEPKNDDPHSDVPLIERLDLFLTKEINLSNLVVFPPVLEPAPVKPLFFDAAWNYINYPGKEVDEVTESNVQIKSARNSENGGNTTKKGWFGLGL